jgi:branched-chain amino acid transport system ATP-binding protein
MIAVVEGHERGHDHGILTPRLRLVSVRPRIRLGLVWWQNLALNCGSSLRFICYVSRTCLMNSSSVPAPETAQGDQAGALEVSDVTVRFGGLTALDAVSLTAPPRKVTGIIGPNGAGKTTLLNVLCGFVHPDAGRLRFGGAELTGLRPHRLASLGVARTLQGLGLFPGLTVLENVMTGASCHARAGFWSALAGAGRSDRDERALRDRALAALDRAGLPDMAERLPGQLSYAHRKRVALARALVAEPRLLLLDEPASGLTEGELPELGGLISQLSGDACVVVVEHRMDLMMSVCDTIAVLDFGKLIAFGPPQQVQADPAVTAAYLGVTGTGAAEPGTAEPGAEEPHA